MNLICSKNAMTQLKLHNNSPLHVVSITQSMMDEFFFKMMEQNTVPKISRQIKFHFLKHFSRIKLNQI